ncbi:MAG: type IVB secretion system protein IcmH/DotU [Legionellaceae bacterium]|nr:type IVB secretion system protein IcmH/DotU [Legionellaceae bacterium]
MSAQDVSRTLTITSPNKIPEGYFRSKLFSTNSTSNKLLAAASPLLSLLERLCVSPTLPAIETVRENIEHELYAFNSRLSNEQYTEEFMALAHYLLYATIDELLGKSHMRLYGEHTDFKAFTPSSTDGVGPEQQFFNIVDYLKDRPAQYLDLLELAYYCLITGFEGCYHVRADGRQILDNLIEEIHLLILESRVNKPHRLFKEKHEFQPVPRNSKPFVLMSTVVICVLAMTFFGSHSLLEHKAKTVLYKTTQYASLDN